MHILGTVVLSSDEMMIRFVGQSYKSHLMKKKKSIKEGQKNGFVLTFSPDGRRAAQVSKQEYTEDKTLGKIKRIIIFT